MIDCDHLRVAFAGTPDFAATALRALLHTSHTVVAVLTQPDRPAGRGRKLTASPVKTLALQHGLPVQQPDSLRNAEAVAALASCKPDVLVVAAYGLILPASVLSLPHLGCLNIHASLLPRWRGAAPIQRALLAGDPVTGICIIRMDQGLDTGAVLHRAELAIAEDMTAGELHDQLADMGAEALMVALRGHCDGTLTATPQPREGVTYAHKLNKQEAHLDFTRSAIDLHRQIQAFHGWPVAEARLAGERIRVWRSALVKPSPPAAASMLPGTVTAVTANAVRVATGDGQLDLLELQRAGKRSMPAADFSRGNWLQGKVFALMEY